MEAATVQRLVEKIWTGPLCPKDLGIIAAYQGQRKLLEQMMPKRKDDIRTIDGFQGGERDCIVLSMVRSNAQGALGFTDDTKRLNVAFSRARKGLSGRYSAARAAYFGILLTI